MNLDSERANVSFHQRAGEIMNNLFRQFRGSVATINRRQDENVFQQQLGKYTSQLKHDLDMLALEMLSQSGQDISRNEWNHTLRDFIAQYIQEFRQKTSSL